jgi:hypothetical protein
LKALARLPGATKADGGQGHFVQRTALERPSPSMSKGPAVKCSQRAFPPPPFPFQNGFEYWPIFGGKRKGDEGDGVQKAGMRQIARKPIKDSRCQEGVRSAPWRNDVQRMREAKRDHRIAAIHDLPGKGRFVQPIAVSRPIPIHGISPDSKTRCLGFCQKAPPASRSRSRRGMACCVCRRTYTHSIEISSLRRCSFTSIHEQA